LVNCLRNDRLCLCCASFRAARMLAAINSTRLRGIEDTLHKRYTVSGRLLPHGIQFRRIQRLFRAARDGQLQHGRCQQVC